MWVPFNFLFTDIHVCHLCFSTRSWSCWICTSSVLSLAPVAASPRLMAYRRHTALPLVNHRTATATRHKHLFMSQHPHKPRIKHTNLTNSSLSNVRLCAHKGTQTLYISCLITRWQSWCTGEERWSHPDHHWGSTVLTDVTEPLNTDYTTSHTLHPVTYHSRMKIWKSVLCKLVYFPKTKLPRVTSWCQQEVVQWNGSHF